MADIGPSSASDTAATPGSETVATPKTSGNKPTGEMKVVSRGGSAVTFDDLEQAENAETKAKREKANEARREKRAEGKQLDDEADAKRAVKPEGGDKPAKEPKERAAPKKEAAEPEAKEESSDDGEEAPKPKAKIHKVRVGDDEIDLAGDAVIPVTINGKTEEWTLQDVLNEVSGKTDYNRKYSEFGVEKGRFMKERDELNTTLQDFFERSQKDPESAWDFLAEMTKQDPIEFKTNLIKQQIAAMRDIALLSPEDQEAWIGQQQLNWREKRVKAKEAAEAEKSQRQQATAARKDTMERFKMDDKEWDGAYQLAHKWNKGKFPTPGQVAAVSRYMMADKVAKEVVPHLAKHEKYGSILEDLVHELMKNPQIDRKALGSILVENFGDDADKRSLKAVAAKVTKEAQRDGSAAGRSTPKKQKDDVWSFDQL